MAVQCGVRLYRHSPSVRNSYVTEDLAQVEPSIHVLKYAAICYILRMRKFEIAQLKLRKSGSVFGHK